MRGASDVMRLLAPALFAAALVALVVVIAASVVVYAIVGEVYQAVAVSLVCAPTTAAAVLFSLLYYMSLREMRTWAMQRPAQTLAMDYQLPAPRGAIIEGEIGQMVTIGDGMQARLDTPDRLANAITLALRPHTKPTQANIKERLPIRNNNDITAAMQVLVGRGHVYTQSDGKTASYEWIDATSPAPTKREV